MVAYQHCELVLAARSQVNKMGRSACNNMSCDGVQAGIKLFFHCGMCLLSIIALLLADAALVVWIYVRNDRK